MYIDLLKEKEKITEEVNDMFLPALANMRLRYDFSLYAFTYRASLLERIKKANTRYELQTIREEIDKLKNGRI